MRRLWARERRLLSLAAAALLLRGALVILGGQRFFPDENRYLRSGILLRHLETGDGRAVVDDILRNPDHTGYTFVGLLPALAQQAALRLAGAPVERATVDATLWLPALLLMPASVACIVLVALVARRAGAPEGEALLAAFLMTCAASMAYYARHLLPYDSALALILSALWVGLAPEPRAVRSFACGLVAGAGVLTYNGYWLSATAVLVAHVLCRTRTLREAAWRAGPALAGAVVWPAGLSVSSLLAGTPQYVGQMLRFSRGAATQADFREGWSLPLEYLWHAEHGLMLVFILGACAAALVARSEPDCSRARLWLGVVVGMYLTVVLLSNGFERIGAFGRLARQLVPFLCLTTAWAVGRLPSAPFAARTAGLLLILQASFNLGVPLTQHFPREVATAVERQHGRVARDATVLGPPPQSPPQPTRYVLLNASYLYPVLGPKDAPPGRVLFAFPHPLQFRPYQYEGFVPLERQVLRTTDISIRLLDTERR